jgi:hypothetical protein
MIIIANWGLGDLLCGLTLTLVSIIIYFNVRNEEEKK